MRFPSRCHVILLAATVAVAVASPLRAQDARWQLPPAGAAEYRRTLDVVSGVADTAAAAAALDCKDRSPAGLLPHLVPSPWLCEGELDAAKSAIGDAPRDLRDVVRAVAFDLALAGKVERRYRRLLPFGDLVATGRVDPRDANGAQTFTLAIATADPEVLPGEGKAQLQQFIRPLCKHRASGSLRMTRTLDGARGVVTEFDAELALVWDEGNGVHRKLVVRDRQQLVGVRENQDAAFRTDVANAIRDGARWLQRELKDLTRRHLRDQDDGARTYGAGRIALGLLTLLHAEVPRDDPVVVAAMDELRARVLVDTYSHGVALMALAERYAPPGEAERLRGGALAAPAARTLDAADRELAAQWLAVMRGNVDTRLPVSSRLAFNYVAGPRFDNSVNQYGLLGLHAAALCGLEIPAATWRAAATHQLEVQCPANGRDARPALTTYRELAAAAAGDAPPKAAATASALPVRGFAYHRPERPPYGSMTAAGVGSLVIARSALARGGATPAELAKIDAGIASGFAWLCAEFQVRSNPGHVEKGDDSWYYWLYGLERTCELAGIARLGGRDWYFEGALQLLPQQQQQRGPQHGSFRADHPRGLLFDATCFAVLFLKKAALAPISGG
jgi:hypothetical protein